MPTRLSCIAPLLMVALAACQQSTRNSDAVESEADVRAAAANQHSAATGTGEPEQAAGPRRGRDSMPERDTTPVDAEVSNVRLSNEGDTESHTLGMPTTRFDPQETVYAEIESTGTASEYTIYAKWVTADGTVLSDYGMRVNEPGLKRTVISLSKPDGWPIGSNAIEIAINGEMQRTAEFQVQ